MGVGFVRGVYSYYKSFGVQKDQDGCEGLRNEKSAEPV